MRLVTQRLRALATCVALSTFIVAGAWAHDDRTFSDSRGDRHETRDERRARDDDRERQGHDATNERSDHGSNKGSSDNDDRAHSTTRNAIEIEHDRQGHERSRGEAILIGSSQSAAAVRRAGFTILSERSLATSGEALVRIGARKGQTVEQLIVELQAIAPEADVAPNHLFRPSAPAAIVATSHATETTASTDGEPIGILDTGADVAWSGLSTSITNTRGFGPGGYKPRVHGTVVAEIATAAGSRAAVADVFGVEATDQLIASAEAMALALDWLMSTRVHVVNISIEGPDNLVLAHMIRRTLAANIAIVAAAGNSGPAAPPAYPAAYPGVIAVTAIDEKGQVYRRANRGDYIAFAAPGVHVASGYAKGLSGTSFAAPVVTAEIARRMNLNPTIPLPDLLAALRNDARDLGTPGRDPIYGWGEITHPPLVTSAGR